MSGVWFSRAGECSPNVKQIKQSPEGCSLPGFFVPGESMATITYTAKRSLISGHTAGEEYTIDLPLEDWTPESEPETNSVTSLGGKKFESLHRIEKSWSAGSTPIDDSALIETVDEFFDSVAAGEVFDIKPFSTTYACTIIGKPRWTLVNAVGFYSVAFKVRKFV